MPISRDRAGRRNGVYLAINSRSPYSRECPACGAGIAESCWKLNVNIEGIQRRIKSVHDERKKRRKT